MDRNKIASELERLATELTAASLDSGINAEMKKLLKKVQSGKDVDEASFAEYTDGELMAMIVKPVLQNITIRMKDAKGFRKNVKF